LKTPARLSGQDADRLATFAIDPAEMLRELGLDADPWQVQLLRSNFQQALLCCSRQSGKSTTTAVLALQTALCAPLWKGKPALVLLLSPSQRQSGELFRKVAGFYRRLGKPVQAEAETTLTLTLHNGSRIVALPSSEETVRCYSGVALLVIDEAARVSEALYKSVRPMLATSKGRLVALSTPFGKQGWFYKEWIEGEGWERIRVTAHECPRISQEFLDSERRSLGDMWYQQEYECSFERAEGLVYPDFEVCLVDPCPVVATRAYAGVDFGWHNPSCALVGILDKDDVLWITEEVYGARMTDDDFGAKLKPLAKTHKLDLLFCDPEAAGSIEKFRRADLPARKAMNAVAVGIRAVASRIGTGRLKVFRTCKNTVREAGLYRYPNEDERKYATDAPIKEHDHSMDALRYLIAGIDKPRGVYGMERPPEPEPEDEKRPTEAEQEPQVRYRQRQAPPAPPPQQETRIPRESIWEEQRGWETF